MHDHKHSLHKAGVLAAVIIPFLGLIMAIWLSWGKGIDLVSFGLFGAFSVLTILGVTVGFHRLLTHKSFETYPFVKGVFLVIGSMSIEGKVKRWVAEHRAHHVHTDTPEDPHSPMKGFLHAHIGWMMRPPRLDYERFIPDLMKDRVVAFVDKYLGFWVVLGFALPAAIGFAATSTLEGALKGFLWGGFARVFFVHHTTWSINSICHIFGSQPFKTDDDSRNNVVLGFLALGEGWHHNHHAFERSAKHGLFWWQPDASYWLIKGLEACGLAWKVQVPKKEAIEAKLSRH